MNTATQTTGKTTVHTSGPGDWINEFLNTANLFRKAENSWSRRFPAVNVIEFDDKFELEAALPGYSRKDVEIVVDNDILKLTSTKEEQTQNDNYRLREFGYNRFERKFQLPETVDTERISARFVNGVLTITLPKREEVIPQPPKEIKIS